MLLFEDFSEAAVKGILRYLRTTLPRYEDRRSRRAVENVIQNLAVHHSSCALKQFVAVMSDLADLEKARLSR